MPYSSTATDHQRVAGPDVARIREITINVIDGSTFLISDRHGDAQAETGSRNTEGLFYRDMRHLSIFRLTFKGASLKLLSTDATRYYAASFFLALDTGTMRRFYRNSEVSVIRKRNLLRVLREEITFHNHSHREVPVELEFRFAADFADLFEVKDDRIEKTGLLKRGCEEESILFSYTRDDFKRGTSIKVGVPESAELYMDCPDAGHEPVKATVVFDLPARSGRTLALDIFPYEDEEELEKIHPRQGIDQARSGLQKDLRRWVEESPRLFSSSAHLKRGWEKSVEDLASLRCIDKGREDEEVLAAGLPWFMALFGRDSLISGYQTVMFRPDLSKGILRALARWQAREWDDFTDAEPGKILHELRHGEMTRFGDSPHRPYYGTVDATPLFLILLHETWLWTADEELVRELEGSAREALPALSATPWAVTASAVLFGGTIVGIVSLLLPYARTVTGAGKGGFAIGLLTAVYGVGQVLGPVAGAALASGEEGFGPALLSAAAAVALGGCLMIFVVLYDWRGRRVSTWTEAGRNESEG